MKKAALLLRVSTEHQEYDSQISELIPIANNFGYEVPKEYIFGQKITGRDNIKKEERQSIKDLKEACKAGDISAIFIWEVSRLSRSSIAGRQFVQDFNELKIPIYFKDRSIWTLNPTTLEEDGNTKLIVGLYFDFAESELKTFKSRSIRGRIKNATEGLATGSILKYGYKKDLETKKMIIDEEEAVFVRDLFNKYSTGEYSLRKLTNYANTSGYLPKYRTAKKTKTYKTKGGLEKSVDSIRWNTEVIKNILTSTIYIGKRKFKGVISNVPAIVSEELFQKVQERIKLNPVTLEKSTKNIHVLQKIAFCGVCCNFYYGVYKERGNAYICSTYTKTTDNCKNVTLNYEKVESIIWNYIKNHTFFFQKVDIEEKNRLLFSFKAKRDELSDRKENINTAIQQEQKKLNNLLETVEQGIFNLQDIKLRKETIDSTIKTYSNDIININSDINLIENKIDQINNSNLTGQAIQNIESDRRQIKRIVKETIDKIVVFKLDKFIALLQVYYLDKVINILYYYRKATNIYYFVDNTVATFNKPFGGTEFPEFSVTDNNNSVFGEDVFGDYSGVELIGLLENYNQCHEYIRFEKVGVQK